MDGAAYIESRNNEGGKWIPEVTPTQIAVKFIQAKIISIRRFRDLDIRTHDMALRIDRCSPVSLGR